MIYIEERNTLPIIDDITIGRLIQFPSHITYTYFKIKVRQTKLFFMEVNDVGGV
jgi:hypothetical protein